MKIQIISDLHLEVWGKRIPDIEFAKDADVLIFAGDISNNHEQAVSYIKKKKEEGDNPDRKALYVSGNHEHYRHEYHEQLKAIRDRCDEYDVSFLEKDTVEVNGIHFIGACLWTDYEAEMTVPTHVCAEMAATHMMDHYLISYGNEKFTPSDALKINFEHRNYIFNQIENCGRKKSVVVTHHAPSKKSVPARFIGDAMNGAFVNDYDSDIHAKGPRLWIHGHTHGDDDYLIGETRIVSHQLGYPGEKYNARDVIEPLTIII